jgi:hypothetical protein
MTLCCIGPEQMPRNLTTVRAVVEFPWILVALRTTPLLWHLRHLWPCEQYRHMSRMKIETSARASESGQKDRLTVDAPTHCPLFCFQTACQKSPQWAIGPRENPTVRAIAIIHFAARDAQPVVLRGGALQCTEYSVYSLSTCRCSRGCDTKFKLNA